MFERFTERSCKVVALAGEVAQRMGFASIAPEHLLLGLLKERSGVAAHALRGFDVRFDDVSAAIERLAPPSPAQTAERPATRPRFNWWSVRSLCELIDHLQLAQDGKAVVDRSREEARLLGHDYVGTEHLLLGLLQSDNAATRVLLAQGLKPDDIRREILALIGAR